MSHIPANCASMFLADNANATVISVKDTWYTVLNFGAGSLNNWAFSNSVLTALSGAGGEYILQYYICLTGAKDDTYEFALAINDTIKNETLSCKYSDILNEEISMAGGACLRISPDDEIKLKVRNRTNAGNATIVYANVSVHRVL